ncbi:MAG: ECF subfamily RNA polymerase sigma-24 factor [Acidobacteria bacterium OLB17]|nr:MAG: ECF subfamily RNA polymerase sigma-24 factor [Acidobacteria bacterium OLB17]MCZ2391066.1 sigma-70 family RNA polymerase sigma factor [Acidobacteriota bacterium]
MGEIPAKFDRTIDEGVARLISRCADAHGCKIDDVRPRVERSLAKYLFIDGAQVDHADVRAFIEEIRSDELCLVLACEKGSEAAWDVLVRDFDATVRSAARKIASDPEDADDLAGSIWAELYGLRVGKDGVRRSKLAYFSGRGSLGGWLRAVTAQLAVDRHRKVAKLVQVEEDRDLEVLAEEAGNKNENGIVSHAETGEAALIEKESSGAVTAALRTAIDGLDDESRLILKLYYFDDKKLKDIGAAFGYHEATASRRLAKIQSDIRKMTEAALKRDHGWTDADVKRNLADAAEKIGLDLEKMLAALAVAVLLQVLHFRAF